METLRDVCSKGDSYQLETLLSDPSYISVALGQPPQPRNKRLPPTRPNIQVLLNLAAEVGHLACVQLLLQFGHSHEVPYDKFVSRWEIFAALESGENAIIEEFVKTWPEVVNLDLGHCGQPLLQTIFQDNFALSTYLLDHGANVNAICGPDKRPGRYLRASAKDRALPYTTLLLQHGAQVAQTGAIRMAAEKGRLDVLRILIEHGGDVNERLAPDAGFFNQKKRHQQASETPLYTATLNGHHDVVVWLLEQGADVEIGDLNGKTPITIAREQGDEELLRVLEVKVERGA
ncbi:hypothetical protein IMSHALPRED_005836 [Imshaugia aleurites]|uniref:Uncharacterized protein n=1 Tax=Imshaugia aleurites TaxID=172621 RepID=A0A8H3FEC0_9LECA|nr:hypothetical protein IMSHALPRED_005836 [Imshaugia aleurites]